MTLVFWTVNIDYKCGFSILACQNIGPLRAGPISYKALYVV